MRNINKLPQKELIPLLIREKELPQLLGISRTTIRNAMAAGRFPECKRIGRCVVWKRQDVLDWIERGCGAVESN